MYISSGNSWMGRNYNGHNINILKLTEVSSAAM